MPNLTIAQVRAQQRFRNALDNYKNLWGGPVEEFMARKDEFFEDLKFAAVHCKELGIDSEALM